MAVEVIRDVPVALLLQVRVGNGLIDANTHIHVKSLSIAAGEETKIQPLSRNARQKLNIHTVGLWVGVIALEDIDGTRCATSFMMEARWEDILYITFFPETYSYELDYIVHDTE